EILRRTYNIPEEKIRLIPHGIHDAPFTDPSFYKDQYGVEGKTVLFTFGLLAPSKGIEFVLQALPEIIKYHPDVVYLVAGVTHPNLLKHEGEKYRLSLQLLAEKLGIEKNVIFYNKFVPIDKLKELIALSDIYLTPYLEEKQITSGTLAYSFGSGNAVVSTPYWHAAELLADGKGIIVPFKDHEAITKAVLRLLDNTVERDSMRKTAFLLGREMIWSKTAKMYSDLFEESRQKRPAVMRKKNLMKPMNEDSSILPKIKLDHLLRMTDSTGIFQHAQHNVPNFTEGYCTDDNARALILSVLLENLGTVSSSKLEDLVSRFLGFVRYAWDEKTGLFRNFLSFQRTWIDTTFSEDCHARAVWSLGVCISHSANDGFSQMAAEIFEKALSSILSFSSPRAWAFAIIGSYNYQKRFTGDRATKKTMEILANHLLRLYKENSSAEWNWFEPVLSYDNAKIPHSLILAGKCLSNKKMLNTGLDSLKWLVSMQTSSRGHFQPVGSDRIFEKGTPKPLFDQQPIEASSTNSACLGAYLITKDSHWYMEAKKAFQWFLGSNDMGISLYNPANGGCFDGLHIDRVNRNQGAESTLAFLLALCEMTNIKNTIESFKEPISQ
ncbi:MAG TPA: glycosyltransferase, partial [bacterium]|nr:glycosyltransferase [bacterium]